MRIAMIGIGNVGSALGGALAKAEHGVTYGVRDASPDDRAKAEALGAEVATVAEAVATAEAVVLAVPWPALEAAVGECGDLAGRIVVDVTNPLAMTPHGMRLAIGFETSAAERIAELAPGARVVKAFNQTGADNMARARTYATRPVMFAAGDDAQAKAAVMTLIEDVGFQAVDAGPLEAARLLEPLAMLWISQAFSGRGRDFAFALTEPRAGAPS